MSAPALTNLQRELLHLSSADLTDDELREVRTVLARHFAEKATAGFEAFATERDLSPEDTDRWAHDHHRASPAGGDGAAGEDA